MTLKLVHNGEPGPVQTTTASAARKTSKPLEAPASDGTLPLGLAKLLQRGEPVVWWGEKSKVQWKAVGILAGAGAAVLALASAFVPELWSQPWQDLLRTVLLTQLPAAAFFAREWIGRRAIVVTDTALADLKPNGRADRLAFRSVRLVKRDWFSGGIILRGQRHEVRVPPALLDDTRQAIASQRAATLDMGEEGPEDSLGWFPRPGR